MLINLRIYPLLNKPRAFLAENQFQMMDQKSLRKMKFLVNLGLKFNNIIDYFDIGTDYLYNKIFEGEYEFDASDPE